MSFSVCKRMFVWFVGGCGSVPPLPPCSSSGGCALALALLPSSVLRCLGGPMPALVRLCLFLVFVGVCSVVAGVVGGLLPGFVGCVYLGCFAGAAVLLVCR